MRSTRGSLVKLAVAAAAVGGMAFLGCAGDKGLLDQVQPGYVKKAELLNDSWYYRRTVVDISETVGGRVPSFLGIAAGDWATLMRVRFVVQEKQLLAYRDHEFVPGSEAAAQPGSDYYGTPLAVFPIIDHFDITREYNPETGEKTNVRIENTTDRRWYEREYMRVDWAKNFKISDDTFVLPIEEHDANAESGGLFYVHEDDAANPYRARIEPSKGYMDFVNGHTVQPDPYACLEVFATPWECGAGELLIRHAFMRVDEADNATYKALYFPDSVTLKDEAGSEIFDPDTGEVKRMEILGRFGYFRLDNLTYDSERELTDSGRLYRIMRFHIWDRDVDERGREIPFANRHVRPIVYYVNSDFPEELKPAAGEVAEAWNQAFKTTVAALQGKKVDEVPDVFILRENSCNVRDLGNYLATHEFVKEQVEETLGMAARVANVRARLENFCAAAEYHSRSLPDPFTWQQMGDPRFSMLYWIPNITQTRWAGYGPPYADPISGRIISAAANVQGWTIEAGVTRALEYIDYMNDELTLEQLLVGTNLPYNVEAMTSGYDPRNVMYGDEELQTLAEQRPSEEAVTDIMARIARLGDTPEQLLTPLDNREHFLERLARVAGTPLEAEWLLHPADLIAASQGTWQPGMETNQELLEKASLVNRMVHKQRRAQEAARFMRSRCFDAAAELDAALIGLAKRLKCLGRCDAECFPGGVPADCEVKMDAERYEMRRHKLREEYFKAVAIHEIGHNVGLRHNFEASWDALNYHDPYWDIELSGLSDHGKLEAGQTEYMYSSIMDYFGKFNADFSGLGKYDFAAIKFGYGQLLELFADGSVAGGRDLKDFRHYHDYRRLLEPDEAQGSPAYFPSLAAMRERVNVRLDWTTGQLTQSELNAITEREVPYLFCSDEHVGRTPTCRALDFGATSTQQMAADYVKYKNYFIFTHFLRNQLVLDWGRAQTPAYYAFANTSQTYKYWYLWQSRDPSFAQTDRGRDMFQAFATGFNMMTEVLAMPEPGKYVRCTPEQEQGGLPAYYPVVYNPDTGRMDGRERGYYGEPCDSSQILQLPLGDAQPFFLGFSEDFVTWTFTYLGTYFDKSMAMMFLVDPVAEYLRVHDFEDFRAFSVSPSRALGPELRSYMKRMITYDRRGFATQVDAGRLDRQNRPQARLLPRLLVDTQGPLDVRGDVRQDEEIVDAALVTPAFARVLQRDAILYGVALMSSPMDATLDFSKYTRVAVKGAPDDLAAFDEAPEEMKAECTLPRSGLTYRALKVEGRESIAYDLVAECAARVAQLDEAETALEEARANEETSQEALEEAATLFDEAQFYYNTAEQTLRFARLVHLIYEHGVEL